MKDMLGSVVRLLVPLPKEYLGTLYDLVEKLRGKNAKRWFKDLGKFLRKENPFNLRFVEFTDIPKRDGMFKPQDWFVPGVHPESGVSINRVNGSFMSLLSSYPEEACEASTIHCSKSLGHMLGISVVEDLGCEDIARVSLSEIYFLMEQQPEGESGILLVDGLQNKFLITLEESKFWVILFFEQGGWCLSAVSIEDDNWSGLDSYEAVFSHPE